MIKTEFFDDFVSYYSKAVVLQDKNLKLVPDTFKANDPLMDSITIYDTVNRRYAGFSKALEDTHGVRVRTDLQRYPTYRLDSFQFHFLHLFHRFTGSGASFQPTFLQDGSTNPKEHGYYNNHVNELATIFFFKQDVQPVLDYIVQNTKPMVTSVGNQPPSLKNGDPSKYRLAQQYYFDNFACDFIHAYLTFLMNFEYQNNRRAGIKDGVDFACAWHKAKGFKSWHFVLTAFVMDTAEYYPELVDPESHCYYGANCVKAFELMFIKDKSDPKNKAQYQESCMAELCKAVNGRPYDVEDVCCDYIRYVVEYIPKGYDHLTQEQKLNNSILKIQTGQGLIYPSAIMTRINSVLG